MINVTSRIGALTDVRLLIKSLMTDATFSAYNELTKLDRMIADLIQEDIEYDKRNNEQKDSERRWGKEADQTQSCADVSTCNCTGSQYDTRCKKHSADACLKFSIVGESPY